MSIARPIMMPAAQLGSRPVSQPVPSGQAVELFEVLLDEVGKESWIRFRFLAPEIGTAQQARTFEQVQLDFEHLCATTALPYIGSYQLNADVVVITMLDRMVEFGQPDTEATQFIETFRIGDGSCAPEELW